MVRSSRLSLATHEFEAILGYLRSCYKEKKEKERRNKRNLFLLCLYLIVNNQQEAVDKVMGSLIAS